MESEPITSQGAAAQTETTQARFAAVPSAHMPHRDSTIAGGGALLLCYVLSLAFFDKAVLVGYDAPWMWIGLIVLGSALLRLAPVDLALHRQMVLWLALVVVMLVPVYFAAAPEQVIYDVGRLGLALAGSVGAYQLLRERRDRLRMLVGVYAWLAVALSVLGVAQVIEANIFHTHHLYIGATNRTYLASGDAGAVTGRFTVWRATGTFAEPSWLGYFLVPALAAAAVAVVNDRSRGNVLKTCAIIVGLICAGSMSAFLAAAAAMAPILLLHGLRSGRPRLGQLLGLALLLAIGGAAIFQAVPPLRHYIQERIRSVTGGKDPSTSQRIRSMREAAAIWREHPFFGIGAGNYTTIPGMADVSVDSGYLLLAAETGTVGLACYLLILGGALRAARTDKSILASQVRWMVMSHLALLIMFNWWFHPLLWLSLTAALALGTTRP